MENKITFYWLKSLLNYFLAQDNPHPKLDTRISVLCPPPSGSGDPLPLDSETGWRALVHRASTSPGYGTQPLSWHQTLASNLL